MGDYFYYDSFDCEIQCEEYYEEDPYETYLAEIYSDEELKDLLC